MITRILAGGAFAGYVGGQIAALSHPVLGLLAGVAVWTCVVTVGSTGEAGA